MCVRKIIERPHPDPVTYLMWNNQFMIVEMLEEDISDPRLDIIKNKLSNPAKMKSNIGEFIYDVKYNWFEGLLDWNGEEITVYLALDPEGGKAKKTLSYVRSIYKKKDEIHEKLIAYLYENYEKATGRKNKYDLEYFRKDL